RLEARESILRQRSRGAADATLHAVRNPVAKGRRAPTAEQGVGTCPTEAQHGREQRLTGSGARAGAKDSTHVQALAPVIAASIDSRPYVSLHAANRHVSRITWNPL